MRMRLFILAPRHVILLATSVYRDGVPELPSKNIASWLASATMHGSVILSLVYWLSPAAISVRLNHLMCASSRRLYGLGGCHLGGSTETLIGFLLN